MKILFLNYEYPPLGGGAGNATEYLLREYAKIPDLEVHLVTSSVDAQEHHFAVSEKIFVHSVPIGKNPETLHFQSHLDVLRYSWVGYRFARKLLSQGGFTAIHAFFSVPCGVQASLLGRRFDIPYIVSLRGADVPGFSERFRLLYGVLQPIIRWVWRRAFAVVAVSQGMKALALRTDAKQAMSVIPNGIDFADFPKSLGSTDGVLRLISTSRLTPRKGLRYLIEALGILREKFAITNVEVLLVGDGHERESLEKSARGYGVEKQVKFIGRVAHNRLAEWYAEADVFVLPSMNEGMSNAMLEALASGLPLLVTRTGGTEEVLEEGKNGLEIKMREAEDIAEKVKRLYDDVPLRLSMAQASRRKAEEMSWENIAAAYHNLYREAAHKYSGINKN